MAMVACPECGREVSERALACPQCGFPFVGHAPAAAADCACGRTAVGGCSRCRSRVCDHHGSGFRSGFSRSDRPAESDKWDGSFLCEPCRAQLRNQELAASAELQAELVAKVGAAKGGTALTRTLAGLEHAKSASDGYRENPVVDAALGHLGDSIKEKYRGLAAALAQHVPPEQVMRRSKKDAGVPVWVVYDGRKASSYLGHDDYRIVEVWTVEGERFYLTSSWWDLPLPKLEAKENFKWKKSGGSIVKFLRDAVRIASLGEVPSAFHRFSEWEKTRF